jgi:hypothetical protein
MQKIFTHQISLKINEKYCRNFKLSATSHFCIVMMSLVFIKKLKIITTKVSKEDFYLVDTTKVPNLI